MGVVCQRVYFGGRWCVMVEEIAENTKYSVAVAQTTQFICFVHKLPTIHVRLQLGLNLQIKLNNRFDEWAYEVMMMWHCMSTCHPLACLISF
jgi:hypothetical protein